jgi:hypothetical protein
MKLLIAAALLAALVAPAGATTIYEDDGGMAIQKAIQYDHASKPIRVMGRCASACTLVLAYESTCAGPSASFVFHAPFGSKGADMVGAWMMKRYRPAVRAWIRAHGGLTHRLITLSGNELHKLVRTCR